MLSLSLGVTDVTAMAKCTDDEKTASLCATTKKSKTTKKTKKTKKKSKTTKTKKKSKTKKPANVDRTYKEACAYFMSKYNLKDINEYVYNDDGSVTFYYLYKHDKNCRGYHILEKSDYQELDKKMYFQRLIDGYCNVGGGLYFTESLNGKNGKEQWCLWRTTYTGKKQSRFPKETKEAYDYFASKYHQMDIEKVATDGEYVGFFVIEGYDKDGNPITYGYEEMMERTTVRDSGCVSVDKFKDSNGKWWYLLYRTITYAR